MRTERPGATGSCGRPEHGVLSFSSLLAGVCFEDVEVLTCSVTDIAAFTKLRIGLRNRVRKRRECQMAAGAGRSRGRDGADPTLRIGHVALADSEGRFRDLALAHIAFGPVRDPSC